MPNTIRGAVRNTREMVRRRRRFQNAAHLGWYTLGVQKTRFPFQGGLGSHTLPIKLLFGFESIQFFFTGEPTQVLGAGNIDDPFGKINSTPRLSAIVCLKLVRQPHPR